MRLMLIAVMISSAVPILAADGWVEAVPLPEPLADPTAFALADGGALILGGWSDAGANTDVYRLAPDGRSWRQVGSLPMAGPRACALVDGRILVAGGNGPSGHARLYDPAVGTWQDLPDLQVPRAGHVLARWRDGAFAFGGWYDPGDGNPWSMTTWGFGPPSESVSVDDAQWTWRGLPAGCAGATGVTLADGRVLVAGGSDGSSSGATGMGPTFIIAPDGTVEMLSSVDGRGPLVGFMLVALPDGSALRIGGRNPAAPFLAGTGLDRFDPAARNWVAGSPPRRGHDSAGAVLVGDGRVLVALASNDPDRMDHDAATQCEFYSPADDTWTDGPVMATSHVGGTLTVLANGAVLACGGRADRVPIARCERFAPPGVSDPVVLDPYVPPDPPPPPADPPPPGSDGSDATPIEPVTGGGGSSGTSTSPSADGDSASRCGVGALAGIVLLIGSSLRRRRAPTRVIAPT